MPMLNPALFAAGLACLAVPILIHLLMRRRRKPIRWAAMRFLEEAYRRTRKRLLIERWLLLALRCLALVLLAVALGRPALHAAGLDGPGARTVYLIIDDSLASTALDASGQPALERHRAAARELMGELDGMRGDRVALISMSAPARGIVLGPSTDLAAVRRLLEQLEPTDARADLQGAFDLVLEDMTASADDEGLDSPASGQVVVAALSEWLDGTAETEGALAGLPEDSAITLLISPPRETPVTNVTLAGVSPVRGVAAADDLGGDRVQIELERTGTAEAVSRVLLRRRTGAESWSTPIGETLVRWSQGQTVGRGVIVFDRSAAGEDAARGVALRAELDGDDLPGDNVRYATVQQRPTLQIALAGATGLGRATSVADFGPADWVRLALAPDAEASGLELRDLPAAGIERERLSDLNAIVLIEPDRVSAEGWSRLGDFVSRGGLLVVMPSAEERGSPVWPQEMTEALGLGATGPGWTVGSVRTLADPVSIDVSRVGSLLGVLEPELGEIAGAVPVRLVLEVQAGEAQRVLQADDGSPLIVAGRGEARRGLVVLMALSMDLEWTDLPARGLFVPLMQEVLRQGVDAASPPAVSIAGQRLRVPAATAELVMAGRQRVDVQSGEAVRRAGVWTALDETGAQAGLAVVNPDAAAGRSRTRSAEEVAGWFAAATGQRPAIIGEEAQVRDDQRRSSTRIDAGWALPALVLLLLALAAEALLSRRASHVDASASQMLGRAAGGRQRTREGAAA